MKVNLENFSGFHTPIYVLEESRLRKNLELIKSVADRADVEIILAFKAYALWKTFPIFREYISSTTASSLSEARLAFEEFGSKAHTFSPAYTDEEIDEIARCSSHLTFNSLSQYARYHERVKKNCPDIQLGLRVNPEYSEVGTLLYNPCAPGTRFGVTSDKLPEKLPSDIEGFHCHCHCESGADVLMTRKDYDVLHLINILKGFHSRYPHLKVILEPGSAFGWQTGPLVTQVVDVVEDKGIRTAIINASFTCHMPDCLEMPYMPTVRNAETLEVDDPMKAPEGDHIYRIGGNSCLSGDFMGFWKFDHELEIGENVIFEDMLHYTTVKTNTFNGITHPAIGIVHLDGELEILRKFGYEDYRDRMD